jgi:hypothetical protein
VGGKIILTVLLLVAVAELDRTRAPIGLVLAIVAIAADWLHVLARPSGVLPAAIAVRAVFFFYVGAVVLRSVVRQRAVTGDTIAGAACGYLFIGFMWAMLYALLDHFVPGSLYFPEAWTHMPSGGEMARYVYFSFVTLTTLGYGDIVPRTADASGLVVAEAVVGQLYLTILIARLVGLHLFATSARGD